MKKHMLLLLIIFCFLTGCSKQTDEQIISSPFQFSINDTIYSYYDKIDVVNTENFIIDNVDSDADFLNTLWNYETSNNIIIINSKNEIRHISVTDSSIKTYKNISVGDDISVVEELLLYEKKFDDYYCVNFSNGIEVEYNNNESDNWLEIVYYTDGSKITRIKIMDWQYANKLY